MSKRKKNRSKTPPPEAPREEESRHNELLVIAFFFFLVGGAMAFAQRGKVVPAAPTQKVTQDVAAMNAPEMRAYGWLSIAAGFGFVGWHFALKRPPRDKTKPM